MEVKFELLVDLLIRFPFMQTSAIWSKMVIIILDTGVWRRGAWLRRKKVPLVMFSVVVLFPWTRREKVSLVMFSVVVLLFDEKGCLVRGRRLLLLKGDKALRGVRTEKKGVWSLFLRVAHL